MSSASTSAFAADSSVSLLEKLTPPPPMIAIGGVMGAGKDTVGGFIDEIMKERELEPYHCQKFALELRFAMQTLTDIRAEETVTDEQKARELPSRWYTLVEFKKRLRAAAFDATGDKLDDGAVKKAVAVLCEGGAGDPCVAAVDDEEAQVRIRPMTVGSLLQVLGTDVFRDLVDKDTWVNAHARRREKGGGKRTMAPDARFENEVYYTTKTGGVSIYVHRPGLSHRKDGRSTTHASENASADFVRRFDVLIVNDGTLEELRAKVRALWPTICMCGYNRRTEFDRTLATALKK